MDENKSWALSSLLKCYQSLTAFADVQKPSLLFFLLIRQRNFPAYTDLSTNLDSKRPR